MQVRISGGRAIVLAIALLAFGGWRSMTAYADLEAGAAEELSQWLRAEYAREQLRGVESVDALTPAKVDSLLASQNVTFPSLKARGGPDDMVVRAEVRVGGRPPAEPVRYYRMTYSTITGWRMKRETYAFAYYTRLF